MDIVLNINKLKKKIVSYNPVLVAVSKTKPADDILKIYNSGHRDFGENKVQELVDKYEKLPKDIQWHLIGHLQSNKVKYIAPFVHLIHAVDSFKLLQVINKEGLKNKRVIPCLLQVYIAREESKFGLSDEELYELIEDPALAELKNVQIEGLMGMATFTENQQTVRSEFKHLKSLYDDLGNKKLPDNAEMKILSMGMSGDFEIALEEGSNMVRVGSIIFGER
ncbi:MAG: YggS family pyridoxal phosphate-dependent enzyme [Cyclobacteriaceae bacterium]|nr:YggS family pyridoxal phosphate-dependent enzyme [Cyclobacteriaceae bacterium]